MHVSNITWCTRWPSWLRHCAARQKVAVSIPDGPIVLTLAPALSPWGRLSLLTEMSTSDISWGVKAVDARGWQLYHLHVPIV